MGRDRENGGRSEVKERNGKCVAKWPGQNSARTKGGRFRNLCTKLEECEKSVIDGLRWKFKFC